MNNVVNLRGYYVEMYSLGRLVEDMNHGYRIVAFNGMEELTVEYQMGEHGYMLSSVEFDCPVLNQENFDDLVNEGYSFYSEREGLF